MTVTGAAANPIPREGARSNLAAINPFFIVENLQHSIAWYRDRLGFQLDFQGPEGDPYYGRVSRDGIGIMLKAVLPDVLPCPNRTRHEWARWDAFLYAHDPDALFDEFRSRGASFVTELSAIDEGLWGFEVADTDGYVLAFACLSDRRGADGVPPPVGVNAVNDTVPEDRGTVERAVPVFPGDDLRVMKAFYIDRLGFTVIWEESSPDGATGIMGLARGTVELVIDCPMTGHGRGVCLSLHVHSADAYYSEWKERVEIDRPPRDEVWNARTFGVTDPAGNLIFVIGPL